ncbi:MAG TPA: hypothetical protein DCK83_13265 [Gallionellaceae bacterium]|nr:hypothetical protein [Gallionellaceae bacterium]
MSQDQPLYGELVIPFNAENETVSRQQAKTRAAEIHKQIEQIAFYLAKERDFAPGHEVEDWLRAEIQVLKSLK